MTNLTNQLSKNKLVERRCGTFITTDDGGAAHNDLNQSHQAVNMASLYTAY